MTRKNEILVGVDGSIESDAAVLWAAAEGASRGAGLMIVHAVDTNSLRLWMTTAWIRSELRELARPTIDAALRIAAESEPSVPARAKVLIGSPTRALLLLSAQAELLVVGRSGRSALAMRWLGSVTERVLAHASSTAVAVDRAATKPAKLSRIIVGTGGGKTDAGVLHFAFAAAHRRHLPLHAIHALEPPGWGTLPSNGDQTPAQLDAEAAGRQAKALVECRAQYPDVDVTSVLLSGSPGIVLAAACAPSDLLVLGHHRRSAIAPNHLGPVASAAIQASPCTVAVVREIAPNSIR